MGGKKGMLSAKAKEEAKAKERNSKAAALKEDAEWEAAGEGKKTKAQARRGAKDEERQASQAKKLEARRMAEEEAEALASAEKKGKPQKITRFELQQQKEQDNRQAASAAQQNQKSRDMPENLYKQLVDADVNAVDGIDARNVDEALAQLEVNEAPKMKYSQYLARELVQLKVDKPGLKAPQYKDIIWKKWIRSPENPLNQKVKE